MPRIQTICSGVFILICSVTTAQSLPKNPTIQQVVGYHQYQQKQWNYSQLPKGSVQYKSDPKYIPLNDRKISSAKLKYNTSCDPGDKKRFFKISSFFTISIKQILARHFLSNSSIELGWAYRYLYIHSKAKPV